MGCFSQTVKSTPRAPSAIRGPAAAPAVKLRGSTTDAPRWPRLKSPAAFYAFVGPTEEAVQTQIWLTLERYRSKADPEMAVEHAVQVPDECGGPPAFLLKSSWL